MNQVKAQILPPFMGLDQDGRVGDIKLTKHTNISEIPLHVEQFSVKKWRLAERLFNNQCCKGNIHTGSDRKGKKPSLEDDTELEEDITQALRSKCFEPHIGHLSPGIQHKEDEPLGWFEDQWDWQ